MNNSIVGRGCVSSRASAGNLMVEALEGRRLLSASSTGALAPLASSLPVQFKPVTPGKVLAGNTASEQVIISNPSSTSETENLSITLTPSLDGTTPAGSYTNGTLSESLTLSGHGKAAVKVPFIPPTTLAAGKYHTLVSVQFGTTTFSGAAPGTFTLTLPPAPTTNPSLIGHYSGLITATSSSGGGIFGGGSHTVRQATFIWETNNQTLTSLSGLFAVGSQQVNDGMMSGSESTTGTFQYTLSSDLINYTIKGKVTPDGSLLKGTFKGTLVNNIFKSLNGTFKITRQTA